MFLQFTIAGIRFELNWEGARLEEDPSRTFYQGFFSTAQHRPLALQPEVVVRLRVHCGELPEKRRDTRAFDAVTNPWRLFRANGHDFFEVFAPPPPHPTVQLALMTHDFRQGEVFRRPEKTIPGPV